MKNPFLPFTVYLLLLTFLSVSCREKTQASAGGDTRIEWTKKVWDFGDITEGEKVSHTFYFKNTGDRNLLIRNIESGCGCTTVNYKKAPVAPGKEGKIEIVFNSAARYGKQYKEISIFANILEKQTTLSIIANVKE